MDSGPPSLLHNMRREEERSEGSRVLRGSTVHTNNRCRLALKFLFLSLSDIATVCGRFLNTSLVLRPTPQDKGVSLLIFPKEVPSQSDWRLWWEFWTVLAGPGWSLRDPLGAWVHPTHRRWEWFYDARDDLLLHSTRDGSMIAYLAPEIGHHLRSRQIYHRLHAAGAIPAHVLPASVLVLSGRQVLRREIGPPLARLNPETPPFWSYLRSLGGEWMWEHLVEGEIDVT